MCIREIYIHYNLIVQVVLDWFGLFWIGLDCFGLVWIVLDYVVLIFL
jgi:hypothetical protein